MEGIYIQSQVSPLFREEWSTVVLAGGYAFPAIHISTARKVIDRIYEGVPCRLNVTSVVSRMDEVVVKNTLICVL